MKKQRTSKLRIRRETLTALSFDRNGLERALGGSITELCTWEAACRTDGSCVSIHAMCFHTFEPGCVRD